MKHHSPPHKITGRYKVAVVDAKTKEVVWEQPDWKCNLILNRGLDEVMTRSYAACFTVGIAGESSTPNSIDSGSATIVCDASGTVTVDGGAFTFFGTDVGNILQWDGGDEERITHFVDSGTVRVTPFPESGTITPDTFTLYHANRTSLVDETKRSTTTVVASPPFTTGFRVDSTVYSRRTWDLSAEASSIVYREAGVGWSTTLMAANTTFSRFLLNGGSGVSVLQGQQLRLTYQLEVFQSGTQPVIGDIPVSGWPIAPTVATDGTRGVQYVGLSTVTTAGASTSVDSGLNCNEPHIATGCSFFMTSTGNALAAYAAFPGVRTLIGVSIVPSQTNVDITGIEYYLEKTASWTTVQNNTGSIRGLGTGNFQSLGRPQTDCGFIAVFDENQIKQSTDEFTFNLGYRWSRTLMPD